MMEFKDLKTCPNCRGAGIAYNGQDCFACGATGVVSLMGEPVTYEDGTKYLDWIDSNHRRKYFG